MQLLSEIKTDRPSNRQSRVTITLRTPELAKALHGTGYGLQLLAWGIGTTALSVFAWKGGFGLTAHATIKFCVADAVLFWATHSANRLWQDRNRTKIDELIVTLDDERVSVRSQGDEITVRRRGDELRFSSRPDQRGKYEERDERRVQHPIGYEYRDAWEIWVEASLDVQLIATVSDEQDARAIVRHLTEENLFVTRGENPSEYAPSRAEPL
jgi:hypothetical protein